MEKALYLLEDSLKDDKSKSSESKAFIKGGIIDPYSVFWSLLTITQCRKKVKIVSEANFIFLLLMLP